MNASLNVTTTGLQFPAMVEDAEILLANGRPWGALSLALVCVSAASRQRFPEQKRGTPGAVLSGKAFKEFIRPHVSASLGFSAVEFTASDGTAWDLVDFLYIQYRCSLEHEGKLPADVHLVPPLSHVTFSFDSGVVSLSYGFVMMLLYAVRTDPVSAPLFGKTIYRLVSKPGVDEEAAALALSANLRTRIEPDVPQGMREATLLRAMPLMKNVLWFAAMHGLTPSQIAGLDAPTAIAKVHALLPQDHGFDEPVNAMGTWGLIGPKGRLTPVGGDCLVEVAGMFDWYAYDPQQHEANDRLRKLSPVDKDQCRLRSLFV